MFVVLTLYPSFSFFSFLFKANAVAPAAAPATAAAADAAEPLVFDRTRKRFTDGAGT